MLEKLTNRDGQTGFVGAGRNAKDEQRVAANFKNIVLDADALAAQDFRPDFRQLHFDRVRGAT